ncbi:hypothetical protein MtrunA17_Chr5g0431931 [Medicago truncatula]|uniref:Transmembrane protein n=1 Tax=Medicago truncatula TaxID=3880 RepID=A0A396HVY2_MEDTR|nr:hypothetical protein MtrunA17_Chr5g0431931 [Medicago truncatula]
MMLLLNKRESFKEFLSRKLSLIIYPLRLISCAAFALMSFFLSRKIDLGFEFDLLDFFLQILTVELMKINLMLSIIATIFCYSLMILRLKFDSWNEIGTLRMEVDDIAIEIDGVDNNINEFQSHHRNVSQQSHSLRRVNHDDGYNWKKIRREKSKRK